LLGRVEDGWINGTGRGQFSQGPAGDDFAAVLQKPGQRDAMLRREFQRGSWSEKFRCETPAKLHWMSEEV
jgi:hypothetical protein